MPGRSRPGVIDVRKGIPVRLALAAITVLGALLFWGLEGPLPTPVQAASPPVVRDVKAMGPGRVAVSGRNLSTATIVGLSDAVSDLGYYALPDSSVKVTDRRIVITDSRLSGHTIQSVRVDTPYGQDIEFGFSVSVR